LLLGWQLDSRFAYNPEYLYQGVANVIVFHRVVAPRLLGSTPDEVAIAAAMPKAHAVFRELSRLLGRQSYFAGEAVSLADLMIAPQLDIFALTPEWLPLTADAPNPRRVARPDERAPELQGDHLGAASGDGRSHLTT
jgi:glutathione S-transferase